MFKHRAQLARYRTTSERGPLIATAGRPLHGIAASLNTLTDTEPFLFGLRRTVARYWAELGAVTLSAVTGILVEALKTALRVDA